METEFEKFLDLLRQELSTAHDEAAGLQVLLQLLLQHEAGRIERKLGPQHPRTQQLRAREQSNLRLILALQELAQLVRINVPEVAADGALVHGRIVAEGGLGIAGLTVCLVDRSGAPIRDTREAMTDASGYFAIPLEPEAVDRLNKQHHEGISLAVLTPRRRPVHQEPRPLTLARGTRLPLTIRLRDVARAAAGTAEAE